MAAPSKPKLYYPGAVWWGQTKNVSSAKFAAGQASLLVMHYTAAGSGKSSATYLHGKHEPSSSAHFVLDRDGTVYQLSDLDRVTWHAGTSSWKDQKGKAISNLNSYAIGIEIANWGYWREEIKKHVADPKAAGWLYAKHANGGSSKYWERYPDKQVEALEDLTAWLLGKLPKIWDIVGHDQIAPSRKVDPGPAFPWPRIKAVLEKARPKSNPKPKSPPPAAVSFAALPPKPEPEEPKPNPDEQAQVELEGYLHTQAQPGFYGEDLPEPEPEDLSATAPRKELIRGQDL